MRFKKLLSAFLAGCMTAAATVGTAALPSLAADEIPLVFDIQCAGSNLITLTPEAVADADVSLTVSLYVPSNPGLNSANLKFQVNDGQIDENGNFGNYGFSFSEAEYGSPYCFDSENEGDPSGAFVSLFNAKYMNLAWQYRQDESKNADSAKEAGTTAWTTDAEWAKDAAFATMMLVVPKGTPAGEYTLDIRKEKYLNALASSVSVQKYNQSMCLSGDSDQPLDFTSNPLKVIIAEETTTTTTTTTTEDTSSGSSETTTSTTVSEPDSTTTTTTTTVSEPDSTTTTTTTSVSEPDSTTTTTTTSVSEPDSTTTTTTTSVSEPDSTTTTTSTSVSEPDSTTTTTSTSVSEPDSTTTTTSTSVSEPDSTTTTTNTSGSSDKWQDNYVIENGGMYYIIGDVCGKPGEEVEVPVYVYGDTGTCAIRVYIAYDQRIQEIEATDSERNWAYGGGWTPGRSNPLCMVTIPNQGFNAPKAADGSILFSMYCVIPEDAAPGTTYRFNFSSVIDPETNTKRLCEVLESIDDEKSQTAPLDVKYYGGSLTVIGEDEKPCLNYTAYALSKPGDSVDLTLFNAVGAVEWSSSDESIAAVAQNGMVTAVARGDAEIIATNGDIEYTCRIHVGLFGDVSCDGAVKANDSMITLIAAADIRLGNPTSLSAMQLDIADVDGDGRVTVKDAQFILMYYGNTMSKLDCNWRELTGNPLAPDYNNLD